MEPRDTTNHNLEAILATLSSYSRVLDQKDPKISNGVSSVPIAGPQLDEDKPSSTILRPSTRGAASAYESTVNPATILDWSNALRHVMKSFAKNEALSHQIKKLIQSQHDHERQWWEGRVALIQKQKDRIDNRAKLDDVLRSVGALVANGSSQKDPEADLRELRNYDQKVLNASKEMASAMSERLQTFGIPFFAVSDRLLRILEHDPNPRAKEVIADGTISKDDLTALQMKMMSLLEDLCG